MNRSEKTIEPQQDPRLQMIIDAFELGIIESAEKLKKGSTGALQELFCHKPPKEELIQIPETD